MQTEKPCCDTYEIQKNRFLSLPSWFISPSHTPVSISYGSAFGVKSHEYLCDVAAAAVTHSTSPSSQLNRSSRIGSTFCPTPHLDLHRSPNKTAMSCSLSGPSLFLLNSACMMYRFVWLVTCRWTSAFYLRILMSFQTFEQSLPLPPIKSTNLHTTAPSMSQFKFSTASSAEEIDGFVFLSSL